MFFLRNNIYKGTYMSGIGMYIGESSHPEIKENRNILITYLPDETSAYLKKVGTYQKNFKNHKKGDPKYKECYRNWIRIYSDILKAWEYIWDYPTVSYGFTRNERNVLEKASRSKPLGL